MIKSIICMGSNGSVKIYSSGHEVFESYRLYDKINPSKDFVPTIINSNFIVENSFLYLNDLLLECLSVKKGEFSFDKPQFYFKDVVKLETIEQLLLNLVSPDFIEIKKIKILFDFENPVNKDLYNLNLPTMSMNYHINVDILNNRFEGRFFIEENKIKKFELLIKL